MKDTRKNNASTSTTNDAPPLFWSTEARIHMGKGATFKLVAEARAYTRHTGARFEIEEEQAAGRYVHALKLTAAQPYGMTLAPIAIGKYDTQEQAKEAAEAVNADAGTLELIEQLAAQIDALQDAAADLMTQARKAAPRGRVYYGTKRTR